MKPVDPAPADAARHQEGGARAVGSATMAGVCAAGALIAVVIAGLLTLFVQYIVHEFDEPPAVAAASSAEPPASQ